MFPTLQSGNHFFDEVIDVEEFHIDIRVVHLNRQVVCDVVAESRHRAVVVRAAPLTEQVRETVHQNLRASFTAVFKEQLLARFFTTAIFAITETPRKGCLNTAAEHHRAQILVAFERL